MGNIRQMEDQRQGVESQVHYSAVVLLVKVVAHLSQTRISELNAHTFMILGMKTIQVLFLTKISLLLKTLTP